MGWIGDYVDAMTFLDLFVTGGGNNYPKWSNKQYDELIAKAKSSNDQAERAKYMHEAEKILMDEMPIAPIYFYTRQVLEKDYVKGAVRVLLGEPDSRGRGLRASSSKIFGFRSAGHDTGNWDEVYPVDGVYLLFRSKEFAVRLEWDDHGAVSPETPWMDGLDVVADRNLDLYSHAQHSRGSV